TRPEGLGGSRDAGPAAAGPRPPRRLQHGYAVQRLRPYGPYGPGGEDEGPALADLAAFFFFLPIAGELTANSTLFFFDLCSRYGYGYGYGRRPHDRNRVRIRVRIRIRIRNEIDSGIRVRAESSSYNSRYDSRYNNSRYDSRYNRNNGSTRPEGLGGSRDAGPAAAGPRPPYVTAAIRYNNRRRLRHGYAVQRLRPYGPYGPYEGRNRLRPYGPYGPYEGRNVG
ncbi:hypothetical protein L249_5640, partial [Ophiocordyceps polyrhachis-furcata BCC 54312]